MINGNSYVGGLMAGLLLSCNTREVLDELGCLPPEHRIKVFDLAKFEGWLESSLLGLLRVSSTDIA